ncbi:MAG TPA: hypothetical protein VKQ30_11620 [Ktedonobacterales bacterium]|nr:hypothetical protein [Ktedonobacterales bacterium]
MTNSTSTEVPTYRNAEGLYEIEIPVHRVVRANGGAWREPAGSRTVRVRVEWRPDVLQEMVERALTNRGGRSSYGPVTVTVQS